MNPYTIIVWVIVAWICATGIMILLAVGPDMAREVLNAVKASQDRKRRCGRKIQASQIKLQVGQVWRIRAHETAFWKRWAVVAEDSGLFMFNYDDLNAARDAFTTKYMTEDSWRHLIAM